MHWTDNDFDDNFFVALSTMSYDNDPFNSEDFSDLSSHRSSTPVPSLKGVIRRSVVVRSKSSSI